MGRLRAAALALVMVLALTAAMFPGCAGGACCAVAETASIHASMPCCERPSVERRDATKSVMSTARAAVQPAPLLGELAATETGGFFPSIQAPRPAIQFLPCDSSPPRFLLNAQFLI